jgi:hypothetical protein
LIELFRHLNRVPFSSFVKRLKDDGEGSAYDQETLSTIKMNNTTVLYLREVNKYVQSWLKRIE